MRTPCLVKSPKKKVRRVRKPTNVTLAPRLKDEALRYCEDQATTLSQLVNDLLVERLTKAGMWPPWETRAVEPDRNPDATNAAEIKRQVTQERRSKK